MLKICCCPLKDVYNIHMRVKEKINIIYDLLDENSPENIEFLTASSVWQLLICIILSAQTTDKQVMKAAPSLFERFPSLESFDSADVEDIKECIKSIGFYNAKANNIKQTAHILLSEYNGEVPLDIDKLTKLPGVGRKTANCIIGHTLGKGAVIVDTHFIRLTNRLGLVETKDPEKIEMEIKKLLPCEKQFRFSMTANLFARDVCHARSPECDKCYLKKYCTVI